MALLGDMHVLYDDIRYFLSEEAERGVFVKFSGAGASGASLDDTLNALQVPGTGTTSGAVAAGLLMCDVVDIDETRYRLNPHRDEVRVGSKVRLLKKGWVYTDQVSGTPSGGDTAYMIPLGKVAPTDSGGQPKVGRFGGRKHSNGFVLLEVDVTYN